MYSSKQELPDVYMQRLTAILEPIEHLITVDHRAIWRRHLAWAKQDGGELRGHLTQRYAANMVFMGLMLSVELMILFNSSHVTTQMRDDMRNCRYHEVKFWIGLVIIISAFFTLFTLISTFTAWGIVNSISDSNAHCFLRSSIGQYAAQLPSLLLVTSIYCFLIWLSMWAFELLPIFISVPLVVVMMIVFLHIVAVYSALGRLIILTGGMGNKRILDESFEKALLPSGLTQSLLHHATGSSDLKRLSATVQYRGDSCYIKSGDSPDPPDAAGSRDANNNRKRGSYSLRHSAFESTDFLRAESEIIRKNAQAMSGPQRVPSLGPDSNAFVFQARRQMESESSVPLSPISNPSTGVDAPRRSSMELYDEENFDDEDDPRRVSFADSWRSDDSSVAGINKGVGLRSSATRGRRFDWKKMEQKSFMIRKNTEWDHESMARLMYDAPPAAGADETENDTIAIGGRPRGTLHHPSVYNQSVLVSRQKERWWSRGKRDSGRNNFSMFRGSAQPITESLSKVSEDNSEHSDSDSDLENSLGTKRSCEKVSQRTGSESSVEFVQEEKKLLQSPLNSQEYGSLEKDDGEEVGCLEMKNKDVSEELPRSDADLV